MTPHEWIETYFRAWRERDSSFVAACFTEDAVYREHPLQEPHLGHDGIRSYWQEVTSTQEDVEVAHGRPIVDGDRAAVEWWARWRQPDAGWVTLPGILYLLFAPDGRCRELREAWHFEQGRHEPPAGWGE